MAQGKNRWGYHCWKDIIRVTVSRSPPITGHRCRLSYKVRENSNAPSFYYTGGRLVRPHVTFCARICLYREISEHAEPWRQNMIVRFTDCHQFKHGSVSSNDRKA